MTRPATSQPQRLSQADHLLNLSDDLMRLAQRVDRPASSHREVEDRINEGERIARAITHLVRRSNAVASAALRSTSRPS